MEQGNVTFKCPACGGTTIIRTKHERQIAAPYKCEKCGFEGPN